MFDSGQKIIWKTEEKAKEQDCVHYSFDRVRNYSSHEALRTFSQWFQPNSLACFLHFITFVIVIISCVIYSMYVCMHVCMYVCVSYSV